MLPQEQVQAKLFTDPHIRPVDVRRDLDAIANLIEISFAGTMDEDGRAYLVQMRRSAQDARMLAFLTSYVDELALPIQGLVWEEGDKLIGNLTLIPLKKEKRTIYLIANVAVAESCRRRGIGRELTKSALEFIKAKNAPSAWLQVREDNHAAIQLYEDLGFVEKSRRTSWHASTTQEISPLDPGYSITSCYPSDWDTQYRMLHRIYHKEVVWNLPVDLEKLRPSILTQFTRLLNGNMMKDWALRKNGKFIGALSWETARTWADNLWVATDACNQDLVIRILLSHAKSVIRSSHPQSVNYPAGQAEDAFHRSGFHKHVTLLWMEAKLEDSDPPPPVNVS
jgi:ribosomal protein S18 acetylase RimI-like enzyme